MKGTEKVYVSNPLSLQDWKGSVQREIANISIRALLCIKYFQMVHDLLRSWRSALRGFPMK